MSMINKGNVWVAALMMAGTAFAGKPSINYWTDFQLEYGICDRLAFTAEQENWYNTDLFYLEETILLMKGPNSGVWSSNVVVVARFCESSHRTTFVGPAYLTA